MTRLQLSEVSFRYNDALPLVMEQLDLVIEAGQMLALMGPSGKGKSTTLDIASGLLTPAAGRVTLNGHELPFGDERALSAMRASSYGFVYQDFRLIPQLTALQNVRLSENLRPATRVTANEAIRRVGLSHRLDHYPDQLSGGEKQRVSIARALVGEPEVILADEPTGSVDEATETSLLELLREAADHGAGVLVVTHSRRVAAAADEQMHL